MTSDFIYLNARTILTNATDSHGWKERIYSLIKTQVEFFMRHNLLTNEWIANNYNICDVIIKKSDFTLEGQAFIMSQAVEKWLAACDRKGAIAAYKDPAGLESRLKSFKRSNLAKAI